MKLKYSDSLQWGNARGEPYTGNPYVRFDEGTEVERLPPTLLTGEDGEYWVGQEEETVVEEKQHTGFVRKMLESKSWLAFLVRSLITIFVFFIGAFIGQTFVIEYHIDYANVLGALCSGLIVGIPLLGPFINEALIERAKKIEQEREHYLKGLVSQQFKP